MGFKGIQGGGWRISDTGLTPSVLSSPGPVVKVEFCIKKDPNLSPVWPEFQIGIPNIFNILQFKTY